MLIKILVNLTKNADFDKRKCSGYGIGFDESRSFSLSDGSGFGENVIISGGDMSSSVHVYHKKKDILILDNGLTQGFNDTIIDCRKRVLNTF